MMKSAWGSKVDIWTFGCLVFESIVGFPFFWGKFIGMDPEHYKPRPPPLPRKRSRPNFSRRVPTCRLTYLTARRRPTRLTSLRSSDKEPTRLGCPNTILLAPPISCRDVCALILKSA
ncbi:hypothetical protein C8R44DRAFT_320796 [Mycena epipterygia]|nr:hypothetical protein C8R44DRAFT_320796 [Mycena epipterygia]